MSEERLCCLPEEQFEVDYSTTVFLSNTIRAKSAFSKGSLGTSSKTFLVYTHFKSRPQLKKVGCIEVAHKERTQRGDNRRVSVSHHNSCVQLEK